MLAATSKINLKLLTAVYVVLILPGCTAAIASNSSGFAGLKGLQTRLTEIQNCFPTVQAAANDSHLLQVIDD